MKTRLPTSQEIEELVAFLPQLYAKGFKPIKRQRGGTKGKDGVLTMPWVEYNKVVEDFFQLAGNEWWCDYNYRPEKAARMLKNQDVVKTAPLSQIKTMLTYCVRGERFCDGHWAAMITGGYIRRLLKRLAELNFANVPRRRQGEEEIMTNFSDGFVRTLVNKLNTAHIPSTIKKEKNLEPIIYRVVRDYTKKALGVGDRKIDDIVFTHGVNWAESKKDQNVIVYGCSNTSDIFIKEPRLGTIYIELKFSKRRGNKEASALPGDLQRSIGQSIIASLVHTYVICLIVCETKIRKRENDHSVELQEMLRKQKHKIELIVRGLS